MARTRPSCSPWVASRDCFLQVTDIDEKGEGTVLFPNKFVQDNRIKANVAIQMPPPGAAFQYRLKDKGAETVTAVCSDKKVEVDGVKPELQQGRLHVGPELLEPGRAYPLDRGSRLPPPPARRRPGGRPQGSGRAARVCSARRSRSSAVIRSS